MAIINGTANGETITGTADADVIDAGAGKDFIRSGSGNDIVYGGLGNDWMNGEAGDDQLYGNEGDDTLTGDAGNDTLYGGDGKDGFFGGGGDDTIYGEAGDDNMFGDGGNDRMFGGDGNDSLSGSTGNDTLNGGAGVNTISGGSGFDTVVIDIASGSLTSAMRADFATLKAWMADQLASAGSTAALSAQTQGAALTLSTLGLTLSTFEAVKIFVDGVETPIDSLINTAPVTDATASINGDEDTVVSGQVVATDADGDTLGYSVQNGPANGTLTLDGATGTYTYAAAANFSGNDSFSVAVTDTQGASVLQQVSVTVGAVADAPVVNVADKTVVLSGGVMLGTRNGETLNGGAGATHILGGAGSDTIKAVSETITTALDLSAALTDLDGSESLSITIGGIPAGGTLSAGQVNSNGTWTLTGAQLAGLTLTASSANDITLAVSATASEAAGGSATATKDLHITFDRSSAQSVVEGGSGGDTLTGSAASDVIYGHSKPNGSPALSSIASEKDHDVIRGGDGNDTIYGQNGNDQIWGDNGNDTLSGGKGDDTLYGGDGNDKINGNSGADTIYDGAGNDTVSGDSGSDVLFAGEGDDFYNGGSGSDTLDFSGASGGVTVDISKKTAAGMGNDTFSAVEKFLGSAFNDSFKGSSAADTINGGAGNDWLRGLGGADQLTGGAGSDTFFWEKTDVGGSLGVDRVKDFAVGDVLDFKKLVSVGSQSLSNFVKVTDGAAGSTIAAKIGGTFVNVAVLEGVHGKTASDLLHDGQLLVG